VSPVILREVSVEQLRFTCGGCGQVWSVNYDVQHVTDGYGHDRDYYFHDGLPSPDPTAPGAVLCPGCGRAHVAVELAARRASPAITATHAEDLGTRPSPGKTVDRATAPLLTGKTEGTR
jgi:hypothetical protein